jgi:photosystem II stability/assembly factor-like uncharacterized protein
MKPAVALILVAVFIIIVVAVVISLFPFGDFLRRPASSIFVSGDGGERWFGIEEDEDEGDKSESRELARANILALEAHPVESELLYAGTEKHGLWRSTDGGGSWQKILDHGGLISPQASVHAVAPGPVFADEEEGIREHFYVGVFQDGFGRIMKTENGGATFSETYVTGGEAGIFFLAVDPARSNIIWAGTGERLLLRSTDFGETWEKMYEFRAIPSGIALFGARPSDILVSTFNRGVEYSTDGGRTFTNLSDELKPYRNSRKVIVVAQDPHAPSTVYLGTEFGLLRSENDGRAFAPVNLVIPQDDLPILDVAVSPTNPQDLFVAAGSNLYVSDDRGRTWRVEHLSSGRLVRRVSITGAGEIAIGTYKD